MVCISCLRGFHSECGDPCCCSESQSNILVTEEVDEDEDSGDDERNVQRKVINRGKRDATLKDQQSTGRKRAAKLFPLDFSAPCEWQGLRFAGGGEVPIVGCYNNTQQARHHGPDKNTLNNDVGNVHRICHRCHNVWHAANDEGYIWNGVHKPHDPNTKATLHEIVEANKTYRPRKQNVRD